MAVVTVVVAGFVGEEAVTAAVSVSATAFSISGSFYGYKLCLVSLRALDERLFTNSFRLFDVLVCLCPVFLFHQTRFVINIINSRSQKVVAVGDLLVLVETRLGYDTLVMGLKRSFLGVMVVPCSKSRQSEEQSQKQSRLSFHSR